MATPSIAGENRSVSPSVIDETVKLDAGGGGDWDGAEGASEPQVAQRSAATSDSTPSGDDLRADTGSTPCAGSGLRAPGRFRPPPPGRRPEQAALVQFVVDPLDARRQVLIVDLDAVQLVHFIL